MQSAAESDSSKLDQQPFYRILETHIHSGSSNQPTPSVTASTSTTEPGNISNSNKASTPLEPNFSPILLSSDWSTDSEEYKVIDQLDLTASVETLNRHSVTTTASVAKSRDTVSSKITQPTLPPLPASVTHLLSGTPSNISSSTPATATSHSVAASAANSSDITNSKILASTPPLPSSLQPISSPSQVFTMKQQIQHPGSLHSGQQQSQRGLPGRQQLQQRRIQFSGHQLPAQLDLINTQVVIAAAGDITAAAVTISAMPVTSVTASSNLMQPTSEIVTERSVVSKKVQSKNSYEEPDEIYEFNADSSIFTNFSIQQQHYGMERSDYGSNASRLGFREQKQKQQLHQMHQSAVKQTNTNQHVNGSVPQLNQRMGVPAPGFAPHPPGSATASASELQSAQHPNTLAQPQQQQQHTTKHSAHLAQSTPAQDEIREELKSRTAIHQEDANLAHRTMTEGSEKVELLSPPVAAVSPVPVAARGVSSLQQLQLEDDDTCVLPPDAGRCFEYVPRWFYNSQTGKCEQFSYGSCGGNSNNFLERHACEAKCAQGTMFVCCKK
ncbi:unnamed protein product [Gongylonema pulchrum]|uniref:BPTI/Kunitz inhibitor domain-containing protein n=1 Tax=Gongylonema pulchrum TaxID=637853 RepID=A0A183DZP6_9BILA|nr:unnamed protein product [Gongylonema pulchrum]